MDTKCGNSETLWASRHFIMLDKPSMVVCRQSLLRKREGGEENVRRAFQSQCNIKCMRYEATSIARVGFLSFT